MNYYLKDNRICMSNEKMPKTDLNFLIKEWQSSLQPCEISESELEKIISELNNARIIYPRKNELIEVTDMIITEEIKTITKSDTITEYQLFFKQPKQVDGEIEAVDLVKYLDECILSCEINADKFFKSNMDTSYLCSNAMKQAYINVKNEIFKKQK